MATTRTDNWFLNTTVRDELQRSGTDLARSQVSVRGIGARECRRTGVFGTKEQR